MAHATPTELLQCGDCGASVELSRSNASRYRAEEKQPLCTNCRRAPIVLSDGERKRLEAWWRKRFDETELREMAPALREGW